MALDKFLNLNSPRAEKSIIGLTKEQFLMLSKAFDKEYHVIQNERLLNGDIRRLPKGGSLAILST
jgi:hypothetical protein